MDDNTRQFHADARNDNNAPIFIVGIVVWGVVTIARELIRAKSLNQKVELMNQKKDDQ